MINRLSNRLKPQRRLQISMCYGYSGPYHYRDVNGRQNILNISFCKYVYHTVYIKRGESLCDWTDALVGEARTMAIDALREELQANEKVSEELVQPMLDMCMPLSQTIFEW